MQLIASLVSLIMCLSPETDAARMSGWRGSVAVGAERLEGDQSARPPWLTGSARVGKRWSRGSLELEAFRTRRFGVWDDGIAAEGYHGLWRNTYGRLRVQLVPNASVLPTVDATAEIFQGFGGPWEITYGARRMEFADRTIHLVDAGGSRTLGAYLARARVTALVPQAGSGSAASAGLSLRRSGATADDLVEGGVSAGREVVSIGADQATDIRPSRGAYLRVQRFLSSRFGVAAGATYSSQRAIPTRTGLELSVLTRW